VEKTWFGRWRSAGTGGRLRLQGTASFAGTTLGVDGIQEFKMLTSAYDASYGMSMGSQMVMISKGGATQYHGDVFDYLRNSALNARNGLARFQSQSDKTRYRVTVAFVCCFCCFCIDTKMPPVYLARDEIHRPEDSIVELLYWLIRSVFWHREARQSDLSTEH
jgi:hypothetical protein